jgi:hypothetical protein
MMAGNTTARDTSPQGAPARSSAVSRPLALLIAVACLATGTALGYSAARSNVTDAQADAQAAREELALLAEAHETLQERNWILYQEAQTALATAAAQAPALPEGTYGDGVYAVGTDIAPGTYQGEVTGEWGYWARLNSTTSMISSILANAVVRGPFELTIVPADTAVELRGVTLTAKE